MQEFEIEGGRTLAQEIDPGHCVAAPSRCCRPVAGKCSLAPCFRSRGFPTVQNNPYGPPAAPVADVISLGEPPRLWNPNAAASWCLLFSPVFGAYLHMRNWQALGDERHAQVNRNWM